MARPRGPAATAPRSGGRLRGGAGRRARTGPGTRRRAAFRPVGRPGRTSEGVRRSRRPHVLHLRGRPHGCVPAAIATAATTSSTSERGVGAWPRWRSDRGRAHCRRGEPLRPACRTVPGWHRAGPPRRATVRYR